MSVPVSVVPGVLDAFLDVVTEERVVVVFDCGEFAYIAIGDVSARKCELRALCVLLCGLPA